MSVAEDNADEDMENVEEEEENAQACTPIDKIQGQSGVTSAIIKKLKDGGYHTCESAAYATTKELTKVKGISDNSVPKIKEAVKQFVRMGFQNAQEVSRRRAELVFIDTGCKALNEMLGGGIETGSITEIFGEFRTGKTQICHTLCVTAQLPKTVGGGEGKAMYVDTEGTFRPGRLTAIAERFGVDPGDTLDNVSYARAYNSEHQSSLLTQAQQMMSTDKYSLIVVDSATALFRTDYCGRGTLSDRQQQLGQFLRTLLRMADTYQCAVVITNQMTAIPDSSGFGPKMKPIGGNIMAHASTTRIMLRKGRGDTRVAKLYDSPNHPEADAKFRITNDGIGDVDDD